MIILIAVIIGMARLASNKGLNPYLWGLFALIGSLGVPFLAGIVIGIFNPNLLYDESAINILGVVTQIVGAIIVWIILELVAKRKKKEEHYINDDLLDE